MKKSANSRKAAWLLVLATACGQELTPPASRRATSNTPESPSEGTTGDGGASAVPAPPAPLPLPDRPIYTTFGGAGDEELGGAGGESTPTEPAYGGAAGSTAARAGAAGGGARGSGIAAAGGGFGGSKTEASAGTHGLGGAVSEAAGGTLASTGGEVAGAGASSESQAKALLFSEYIEGAGSLKALEIFAPDATSLEGCELDTYFNGKTEPARLALHGSLGAGAVQVLCSSALATLEPGRCERSTNLTFNGDDALALSCNGVVLDVIGQIGVDPGDSWGAGATVDHCLRRSCAVTSGRVDGTQPFDPELEWTPQAPDDLSDLGQRQCSR